MRIMTGRGAAVRIGAALLFSAMVAAVATAAGSGHVVRSERLRANSNGLPSR